MGFDMCVFCVCCLVCRCMKCGYFVLIFSDIRTLSVAIDVCYAFDVYFFCFVLCVFCMFFKCVI